MAITWPRSAAIDTALPSWSRREKSGAGIDFGGMTMSAAKAGVGVTLDSAARVPSSPRWASTATKTTAASSASDNQVRGLLSIPVLVPSPQLTQYQAGGEVALRSTPS